MRLHILLSIAASLLLAAAPRTILPAQAPPAAAPVVDAALRRQVVESLAVNLERAYVFPAVGNQMAAELRSTLKAGAFDAFPGGEPFAQALTDRMQGISHDKHLHVDFFEQVANPILDEHPSAAERARRELFMRRVNYGFERVQRLRGNVGYLDLRGFTDLEHGRATALAALRFLSGSDALIIDLRKNGGGEPAMVALLSSILFPKGKKVHLNDLHWRKGNKVEQYWTEADLDLPRITGEVFVLTSSHTFSAAEEFTYNLKQLKRATQVGETTGGGANPGQGIILAPHFGVFLPTGHAVNPITQDNWEGKGCVPEIAVPAAEAFKTAYVKALETLLAGAREDEVREALTDALATARNGTGEP